MCQLSDITPDILFGLFGGLIGAFIGYRAAIAATKLSERNTALAELKKSIIPVLIQIQAEEQNCPSGTIEQCLANSEILFQNCVSMLRPSDAKKLKRLWRAFKCGDQPDQTKADTLMEYLSKPDWKSVQKNREKVLSRLHDIITFQINA
ncbi:MAG: hypothetical protein WCS96_09385 [Victivallales bacterium]